MLTSPTTSFTAAGVTVTPNAETRTITLSDTAGRSITVGVNAASDIAHEVCDQMREGCTEQRLHSYRGCPAIFSHQAECGDIPCPPDGPYVVADGSIGKPAEGTSYGSIAEVRDEFWCVTDLYTGIHRVVAGIKAAPTQARLAELGVSGYITSGGPWHEDDGHALFVSSMDDARLLRIDEAALLRLGRLGLLGSHGRRDGSILATDLLRALDAPCAQRI